MNKQSFITILLTIFMSIIGARGFAYDIEVANSDGKTIYYSWANEAKTEFLMNIPPLNDRVNNKIIVDLFNRL